MRIIIKNALCLRGTYKWAFKRMLSGDIIKSDMLKCGYSLAYDYEFGSIVIYRGFFGNTIYISLFADEFEYLLKNIDNWYVATNKKIQASNETKYIDFRKILKHKSYYIRTNEIFK